jgi:hypothetical protein
VARSDEQKAHNQSTFRRANEEIKSARDHLGLGDGRTPFVCECEDERCRDVAFLTAAEYEEVRAHPRRFLVVLGHESTADRVVERRDYYWISEKLGVAGELAAKDDPRSSDESA